MQQKDPIPFNNLKTDKKVMLNLEKHESDAVDDDGDDDDSDLSNDTPLSEYVKQEASAKQLRSQTSTPKDISSTTEMQSIEPEPHDQPPEHQMGDESSVLDNKFVDNSSDLLENQLSQHDNYVESLRKEHSNDFEVKSALECQERPPKIELSMPIDSFESDSNDEKSMEDIKREIEALPELKDSNSSENSQDEKIGNHNVMSFKENATVEHIEPLSDKLDDNSMGGDQTNVFDKKDTTITIDLVDTEPETEGEGDGEPDVEPIDAVAPNIIEERDELPVESSEIKGECIDLTETKNEFEESEPANCSEMICDTNEMATDKSEPVPSEKVETIDIEECQPENGEAIENEAQQPNEQQNEQLQHHQQQEIEVEEEKEKEEEQQQNQQPIAGLVAETVTEMPCDETHDKEEKPFNVEEIKAEVKTEADSSQQDPDGGVEATTDDQKPPLSEKKEEKNEECAESAVKSQQDLNDGVEAKTDDQKPALHEEKEEKTEGCAETAVKQESDDQMVAVDGQKPATTPNPVERKVSTDDELFEDAKDTIEIEALPPAPKRITTPAIVCDTDDDSVIEVVKEEKVGVKRDYSRRRKDQSHSEKHNRSEEPPPTATIDDNGGAISSRLRLKDRDRSESPFIEEDSGEPLSKSRRRYSTTPVIDSPAPVSPASSDDRDHRSWKKSILLLYSSLSGHKCASIFAKPITDEQAPNYSQLILQPMDLQSLKRNIDSGQIRNIFEFQIYVMRMCYNAIFYNINDDVICERAKEMLHDALTQINEFSLTWKKENEKASSVSSTSSNVTKSVRGRKSNRLMN